jgi:L-threonylcarbamoyladenylate synthase
MSDIEDAVSALGAGRPVILPTDTVYGLCANPYRDEPVRRAYRLPGRDELQPSALVAADLDALFECIPEARGRVGSILRAILPGPYTVVIPNPARRYRWLTGSTPDSIGVRVPNLPEPTAAVVARVGAVMATSANLPGEGDPCRLEDVPAALRDGAAALVDGGELPGKPSTVLDVTGRDPVVLREGAVPAEEALRQLSAVAAH